MTLAATPGIEPPARRADADLLAAVAREPGDPGRAALGELVRRYIDFVYAAARRQLADRHAAEDVTQAVFLVLARKAGHIHPHALANWLHQTTRYAADNARRAAQRRKAHERAAARAEVKMPYVLPEPDPLLRLLDDAIASLGTKDRCAIIDRYLRGRDVEAIAAALQITPAAAQKRLERAVVRLRQAFVRAGVPTATAAITATLASVAPTPANAAPAGLAAAFAPSALPAGAPTALIAKGVLTVLTSTQIKITAGLLLATGVLAGAGVEVARRAATSEAAPTTPAVITPPVAAPTSAPAADSAAARAATVLDGPGGGTDERGAPLETILDRLRVRSRATVFVNWKLLQTVGVLRTTPVTADLTGLTVRQQLRRIFAELDGAPLGFAFDDGVLTISTVLDLGSNVETRTYDARALLRPDTPGPERRTDDLLRRVRGLNPLSWKDNGGGTGSGAVRELAGQLIITQTPAMHARVALELGRGQPADVQAALRAVGEHVAATVPPPQPLELLTAAAASPLGRTMAALDRSAAALRFDAVQLSDALNFVSQVGGVVVDPQWKALADAGVRPETPVTVRLQNVAMGKALSVVLAAAATGGGAGPVFAVTDDGHVTVSTRVDLFARHAVERSYPLGDLIAGAPATAQDACEQLRALVRDTIRPETWAARPGEPGGTVTVDGDRLRVFQTPDVHALIDALLQRLRDQRVKHQ